jgi:hypothetical protein
VPVVEMLVDRQQGVLYQMAGTVIEVDQHDALALVACGQARFAELDETNSLDSANAVETTSTSPPENAAVRTQPPRTRPPQKRGSR